MRVFVIARTIADTPEGGVMEVMGIFDNEERAVAECKPGEWIGPMELNTRQPEAPQPWPGGYYPNEAKWTRHRFKANADDFRPVAFPPPGPYWCSGHGDHFSTVVAYLPAGEPVHHWWPEATEIESEPRQEITFTERFAKPAWWNEADSSRLQRPERNR